MIQADDPVLKTDPGAIALGDIGQAKQAAENPDPLGPACAASLSSFRSALFFKNIFTALVALLGLLTLGALAFCLVRILASSWEAANTLAAIAGVVTGGGALFLGRERSRSDKVLNGSLADVQRYCGEPLADKLS
ncbi:MAG TPA: hypothetical protein VFN82_03180 [Solirubrobacterales bacterium]|nr:hypothetical protein [Solirubrobacterales bacterium]